VRFIGRIYVGCIADCKNKSDEKQDDPNELYRQRRQRRLPAPGAARLSLTILQTVADEQAAVASLWRALV
jgi:hypothetical protein